MSTIQTPRGTKDILPTEIGYWQHLEATARQTLGRAAFKEIRTPIFEQTELFARGIGEATDVVGKEMYTFMDRGDRSITLRPEGTAGVVRSFIEHKLHGQGGVQRLWYCGPMFRYERPKAGRQRQFHQIGAEVFGCSDPRADVEAISIAVELLTTMGLKSLTLALNSIGDREDRKRYREQLVNYLTPYKDELDSDSQNRLTQNPLRILDSKDTRTQEICKDAPNILDALSTESAQRFETVQKGLQALGISYKLDPCLVRGLDYYTHTAFEIQSDDLGTQATICGGGRYDGLVSELGGPKTSAVGWALGMERLILLLQEIQPLPEPNVDFYVVSRGDRAEIQALGVAQTLRQAGYSVEVDLSGSAFGKQFKRGDRAGAKACAILGDSEADNKTVQIKWLKSGEQTEISQDQLSTFVAESAEARL
ncbi:MAG: histidine--tRNA ligase [Cyanobacteria bacterium P01_D01_bin.73]